MKQWPTKKLGEIAKVQMGQSPPGSTYNRDGQGLPFFQGKAEFGETYPVVVKWCSRPLRIAEAGDILLSVRAPVGPTNLAKERCCIGRGLAAIRTEPSRADQRYIWYYLRRFESDIAASGVGSTFSAINRTDIERLELPMPTLTEQEQLVGLLDAADELRKLGKQADDRTEDLIPALFYEMFGDPAANPFGWPVRRAGELMSACDYGTSQKANKDGQGIPVLRMGNVTTNGRLDLKDMKSVVLSDTELTRQQLRAGDVLFNRTNSRDLVGKTGMWDARYEAVAASYFIRARFRDDIEHPVHFTTFMNLPTMKRRLAAMARGAIGQSNINSKELQAIELPVPPVTLQNEFANRVSEIHELEAEQAASRRRLDDLFQSMLHRAFNSEM